MQNNHTQCRVCQTNLPPPFLDLGGQPLANNLSDTPNADVARYPLALTQCPSCHLVQLNHVVPKEEMFSHYLYTPSQSKTFVEHFTRMAKHLTEHLKLEAGDLVCDVGSNDGLLLSKYPEGIRVLGIEPASNIAELASVPTTNGYWTPGLATQILATGGHAKLITANNVFAHIDNWKEFIEGVNILLSDDGTLVIEAPGLLEMLTSGTYDLIYHEHLSYLSLDPLIQFFYNHGFYLYRVEEVPIHGGSLRLFVKRRRVGMGGKGKISDGTVGARLTKEVHAKLHKPSALQDFAAKVSENRQAFLDLLRSNPVPTAGYTAPAKATVMISYCGLDSKDIAYIIEDAKWKQGKYVPGTDIQILSPQDVTAYPERFVIFAWNIYSDLLPKIEGICEAVIIPMPKARLLEIARV